MLVSFINKNKYNFEQKADMNMIQNDNQNVDGVQKLDSHYYLFIADIIFITLQL